MGTFEAEKKKILLDVRVEDLQACLLDAKKKKKASSSHCKQLKNMRVVSSAKPIGTENTQAANRRRNVNCEMSLRKVYH